MVLGQDLHIGDEHSLRTSDISRFSDNSLITLIEQFNLHQSGQVEEQIVMERIVRARLPFKCQTCGKCYSQKNGLDYHIRSAHTGEKPFQCEVCGKRWLSKSILNDHRKIHLGVKPHSCPFCSKCFLHFGHLKNHISRHIGEKYFSCDHCSKEFVTMKEKKDHCARIHGDVQEL